METPTAKTADSKACSIWIHWNRHQDCWSAHFQGACHLVDHIQLYVPSQAVYKPQKRHNPRAFFKCVGKPSIANGILVVR